MIKYALRCEKGHGFESWFQDSGSFDKQRKRGLVDCPVCGSIQIEKQIMAPNLRTASSHAVPAETPVAAVPDQSLALTAEPEMKLRALMRELHAKVVANTEDVGVKFAEEARKIHYGEVEDRAIRGKASLDDARALHEEGIDVMPLPVLPDNRN